MNPMSNHTQKLVEVHMNNVEFDIQIYLQQETCRSSSILYAADTKCMYTPIILTNIKQR